MEPRRCKFNGSLLMLHISSLSYRRSICIAIQRDGRDDVVETFSAVTVFLHINDFTSYDMHSIPFA